MEINVPEHIQKYVQCISSVATKNQIDAYVKRQSELGHILKRPVSATLRSGIHELRPGDIRILFFFHENEIVLIHALRKTAREVPSREIDAAIRLRKKYINGEIK